MLNTRPGGNRGESGLWTLALFAALTALLVFPIFLGTYRFDNWSAAFEFGITAVILALLLTALRQASIHLRPVAPLFWILLALIFVVRLTWFLALDFSGEGFNDNFYAHISVEAVRVGVREYAVTLLLALLVFTFACVAIVFLGRKPPVKPGSAYATVTVAFALFFFVPLQSPEQQFLRNYMQFREAVNPGKLSRQDVIDLQQSGLVTLSGNDKANIIATAGPARRNLILVYLESFHLAFTDDGPFPDLTPNINRLKREHGHHSNWLSSADATMEGIISTQCGTLVSTPQGGNTFANTNWILPRLAACRISCTAPVTTRSSWVDLTSTFPVRIFS